MRLNAAVDPTFCRRYMKEHSKLSRSVLALILLALSAFVAADSLPNEYYLSTTASTSSTGVTFGFPARKITVLNDDASISIYVNAKGGAATASSPEVKAGETYPIPAPPQGRDGRTGITVLAASGTPAYRVYAHE